MRLDDEAESQNVEDRRGGGGGFGLPIGGKSIGIGTVIIALAASYFFGIDPSLIFQGASVIQGQQQPAPQSQAHRPPASDQLSVFTRKVLGNTERTSEHIFETDLNRRYAPPTLVMFSGATPTACGTGQSAMGPFYCPADQKV